MNYFKLNISIGGEVRQGELDVFRNTDFDVLSLFFSTLSLVNCYLIGS